MHAFTSHYCDVQGRIFERLKCQAQAALDTVWRFVVLVEARNHRVSEETASGNRASRTETQWRRIGINSTKHVSQRNGCDIRCARKSKESRWAFRASPFDPG